MYTLIDWDSYEDCDLDAELANSIRKQNIRIRNLRKWDVQSSAMLDANAQEIAVLQAKVAEEVAGNNAKAQEIAALQAKIAEMLPDHEAAVAARAADALYLKHYENERNLRAQAAAEHEKTIKLILDQAEQERAKMVESKRKSSEHI